jgi:uncharacterized repeat protein (TIGR01451 family)
VLPSTTSLTGIFAPTSDQSWLTIGAITGGIVNFSFTANTSTSARSTDISLLGQLIAVTQNGGSGLPDLTMTKAHVGLDFTLGQQGAQYILTVTNGGSAATSGTITVTDAIPAGLTFVSGSGGGFACSSAGQLVTCANSTTPIGVSGTAAITLNVNVAVNAGSPLANMAVVACTCTESNTGNNTSNTDMVTVLPPVTVTPATLAFGSQGLNSSTAPQTITVTNNQSSPATVNFTLFAGGPFDPDPNDFNPLAGTCGTTTTRLPAYGACTISVQFTPHATGARSALLTFSGTRDATQPLVTLTGMGVLPVTVTPASLAFGSEGLNSPTVPQTITVTNNQSVSTTFSFNTSGADPGDFTVTPQGNCGTAAPGSIYTLPAAPGPGNSCTISVQFAPRSTGARSALLTFSGTPDATQPSVSFSGMGVLAVTVTPATLNGRA